MTTIQMTHAEGRRLSIARKRLRREINAGRVQLTVRDGQVVVEPIRPATAPRRFGEGLGERHPIHRLPVPISDMEWWEQQNAEREAREMEERAAEFAADGRFDGWF